MKKYTPPCMQSLAPIDYSYLKSWNEMRLNCMKITQATEQTKYYCDICGKEIEQNELKTNVVEITEHNEIGNSWNKQRTTSTYHAHKDCLGFDLQIMRENHRKTPF